MTPTEKQKQCPEFPFFGASYPDARCIDGYLWDLDSCTEDPNVFTCGGDIPCPFCNKNEFIEEFDVELYDAIIKKYDK